jgi:peptide/nickel transport system substrate-binding protein
VTTAQPTTAEPGSGSEGGKLTYAIPGQSQELNPLTANTPGTRRLLRQVSRGLTIIENDLKPHPWLAKDWSINGTTYTFNLREGVRFHPPVDREMTAEDVVATYEWIKNNEAANMHTTFQRFTNFSAPDKYTVEIELEEPFTYTLLLLGELDTAIVPKGYIEDMADQPVGTGPFQFQERKVGTYTRLEKFDDWWKDKNYVDVVEQRPIPEASVRLQELTTGDIDFVTTLASKDREKVQNASDLELQMVKNVKTEMFTFNTEVEPFGEPKVRKAIRHAINDKETLQLAAYGFGATANRPFAGYEDYVPSESPPGQDFETARSLLQEAGYGDGFSTTIQVTNAWQRSVRAAKPIQQWLEQIGIDMEIQTVTKSNWYSNVFNGDKFEMSAYGYTGTPDGPYVNMHDLYHSDGLLNVGYWENQEMDKYVNQIARLPNGPDRAQATRNALKVAWEKVPKFSMFFHHFLAAKRSNVQNPLYWGPAELRLWRNPLTE